MTRINQTELEQIEYVDQALMWCVIELEHSNHHPDNVELSDNAAVRAEAVDFVSWAVVQDDQGNGQFTYTALLPIYNPHPMLTQLSIVECVKSYTIFRLPGEQITYPVGGKGMLLPEIPTYIDTMEKLLVWLVQIVEGVTRYLKLINALIAIEFEETPEIPAPTVTIENGVPTVEVGNNLSKFISASGEASSGEGIISQFENPGSDTDAIPDWYLDYLDNLSASGSNGGGGSGGGGEPKPVDPGNGNSNNGFVDTLPVCKEQDPKIISFSKDGILNFINK